ncbi:MAG: hypothetical protein ACOCYF_02510 [Bacteroidota bacterium]
MDKDRLDASRLSARSYTGHDTSNTKDHQEHQYSPRNRIIHDFFRFIGCKTHSSECRTGQKIYTDARDKPVCMKAKVAIHVMRNEIMRIIINVMLAAII